ncbi:hypothetical protein U9R90_08340 [Streptomyces sp. E11-3]|uniref:hypothetical protein n=1 Tax=Streptomyces sp. E11-3 TaxID=3110112 RepID=UPI003980E831
MAARWGLIVEENDGMGERKTWATQVLGRVEGSREEALAQLEKLARSYTSQHPMNPTSVQLYRTAEGFLMLSEGSMRTYHCRFSVAELLYDSVEAERAAAAARAAERAAWEAHKAAEKAARRAERGPLFGRRRGR